jgi:hypothetical protein
MQSFSQFLCCLCFSSCLLASDFSGNVEVRLKEPSFEDGVLKTDQGGVITSQEIRIQAKKIKYTNKTEDGKKVISLTAEGDLLFEYGGKIFVGSRLQYDFVKGTGTLWDGRTSEGIWFVGGDKIDLEGNGNYAIYGAFVTSCENTKPFWELSAARVKLNEKSQLSTSKVQFKFFEVPVFWLPSFKANLKNITSPPLRYKVVWDRGIGPRISMRYRVFSWEDLSLFLRLDYRITKGPGGAVESEYFSKDERTTFVTRTYGAYDKEVPDEHGFKRYRLQGLFHHDSKDGKTITHATYDKYHDLKMISDFPSSDFEIDTQKRTQFLLQHQEDIAFGSFRVEPRLNAFESINQKLPLAKAGIRPMSIGSSGLLSENFVSAGYLDYVYAHDLNESYHGILHETHAARLETRNRLYRPFVVGPLHVTPTVGLIGIFYNNNPFKKSVGQGVITYGGKAEIPFYRRYSTFKHTLEPYIDYFGLTHPRSKLRNHYIFTIEDGLNEINSLKMGLCNKFFLKNSPFFSPAFNLDLHTYAFFNDKMFKKTCPKGYLFATWSQPSYLLTAESCWNFEEGVLDFANLRTDVTVNAHAAWALEFRHRSRYDWRKADHESFILDMARSIPEMEDSPLSDKRNTFLSQIRIRISPTWSFHFSSHHGWGRLFEPSYNSYKIDLFTLLASHWKFKGSYMHTTNDDRVSVGIQLVK